MPVLYFAFGIGAIASVWALRCFDRFDRFLKSEQ